MNEDLITSFEQLTQKWQIVQYTGFKNWVNLILAKRSITINRLENEFQDGVKLSSLIELLSNKKIDGISTRPKFQMQKMSNITLSLELLKKDGLRLENLGTVDIYECNLKLIMGLIWLLILNYHLNNLDLGVDEENNKEDSNLGVKEKIIRYCQNLTKGYPHQRHPISNVTSNFNDGKVLACMIHAKKPELINPRNIINSDDKIANLKLVVQLLEDNFEVPHIVSAEDMSEEPEEKVMMTFLSYVIQGLEKYPTVRFGLDDENEGMFEINDPNEKQIVRNENGEYSLNDDKVYVGYEYLNLPNCSNQVPIIYIRYGKHSSMNDQKRAKEFADSLNKQLGGNSILSLMQQKNESDRFKHFLNRKYESVRVFVSKHEVSDVNSLTLQDTKVFYQDNSFQNTRDDHLLLVRMSDEEGLFGHGPSYKVEDSQSLERSYSKTYNGAVTIFPLPHSTQEFIDAFTKKQVEEVVEELVEEIVSVHSGKDDINEKVESEDDNDSRPLFRRIKLPVLCRAIFNEYQILSGTNDYDYQEINAKFVCLWYGFTSLNWNVFKLNPEACEWENHDSYFTHELLVRPIFDNNVTQDIYVDVPSGKNVVFRVRYQFKTGRESESKVFFVNVDWN